MFSLQEYFHPRQILEALALFKSKRLNSADFVHFCINSCFSHVLTSCLFVNNIYLFPKVIILYNIILKYPQPRFLSVIHFYQAHWFLSALKSIEVVTCYSLSMILMHIFIMNSWDYSNLLFMKLPATSLYQLQILPSQAAESLLEADSPSSCA